MVVLHESFGLNNDIRRIAARFAQEGYAALAPDLYSHGTRLRPVWSSLQTFRDLLRIRSKLRRGAVAGQATPVLSAGRRSE